MTTKEMITPVGLRLQNRRVVFAGGGAVAERKLMRLLDAGAHLTVVAPASTPMVQSLAAEKTITLHQRPAVAGDFAGAFLVFIATPDVQANATLAAAARDQGALVNRADEPDDCDFMLPALAYAKPIHIGVFSGSPALSKWVRKHVERTLGPEFPEFAAAFAEIRKRVRATDLPQEKRAEILNRLLNEGLYQDYRTGGMRAANVRLRSVLDDYEGTRES